MFSKKKKRKKENPNTYEIKNVTEVKFREKLLIQSCAELQCFGQHQTTYMIVVP